MSDPTDAVAAYSAKLIESLTGEERAAAERFGMPLEEYAEFKRVRTQDDYDAAQERLDAIRAWKAGA